VKIVPEMKGEGKRTAGKDTSWHSTGLSNAYLG
jgi:hypothetical protein